MTRPEPPMAGGVRMWELDDAGGVEQLAQGLLDARRPLPWCVVSIPAGAAEPLIDVTQLAADIGDVCRVIVLPTGDLSRRLEQLLPAQCQVYGGAARVYPVGVAWWGSPRLSPLRFLHRASDAEKLVTDALDMATAAGLFAQATPQARPVSGRVVSFVGETRAMVRLDSGTLTTVQHELTFPAVPLAWVLSVGQRVSGLFDAESHRFQLDVLPADAAGLVSAFPFGSVTLALVLGVDRQWASLAVHPSVPIRVERRDISSNPRDRADLLLAEGDVVAVRVVRDEQGRVGLRLSDVDDDETVRDALPLVAGGEPWLRADRHRREPSPRESAGEPGPAPAGPAPAGPSPAGPVPAGPSPVGDAMDATVGDPHPHPVPDAAAAARRHSPVPGPGPRPAAERPIVPAPGAPGGPVAAPAVAAAGDAGPASALLSTQLQLEQARAEIRALKSRLTPSHDLSGVALELREVVAENGALRAQLARVRTDQSTQRELLRKARQHAPEGFARRRERFDDGDAWVAHEVHLAWIGRLTEPDRALWPLPESVLVGARFAESLAGLDDGYLAKAFKACVDAVTGRIRELPARNVHALRSGVGANSADVVRDLDGARCMRAYIEQNTASARRLHYWALPDGGVELCRVVLHDDVEP